MARNHDIEGLARQLASLPTLGRQALLDHWRRLYRSEPPADVGDGILIRAIAYRLQEQAHGGLKPATKRLLARIARDQAAGRGRPERARGLRPGSRLVREWHGNIHEVTIMEKGVQFQGKHFRSLSEVARAITGTPWSGPRFFGLKGAA